MKLTSDLKTRSFTLWPSRLLVWELLSRLVQLGHVQRVPGDDTHLLSAGFAGLKDIGRDFAHLPARAGAAPGIVSVLVPRLPWP